MIHDPIQQMMMGLTGNHHSQFDDGFGMSPQHKMHQGLETCQLMKEYVLSYPCLQDVVLLLKRFLAVNDLNIPYQGK